MSSSVAGGENSHMIIQRLKDAHHFCTGLDEGRSIDTVMVEDEPESDSASKQILGASTSSSSNASNIVGVVVNGFHPQLSSWQTTQSNIHIDSQRNLENKVCDAVKSCRSEENEKIRVMSWCNAGSKSSCLRFSSDTSIQEIYSDIFENSSIPQVIATPGGRFGAWNQEFLKVCGFAQCGPYASLTLFDLVVPDSLPLLHQIFLTSLYEEFPGSTKDAKMQESNPATSEYNMTEPSNNSEDGSGETSTTNSSYLSLTVPCVEFLKGQTTYFITLSLMYDSNPEKRCFHCILTQKPASKVGEIFYIDQNELLGML